ncbi:MAG: ATP synthase F1 subunit epsilon [Cytophagales bacterium]|nr:ATP synthase F1 subunit epsilon [Cytophagales bacterium]
MHLDVITPDKKVFDGEAAGVQLPGSDGSFEILNNHAPFITTLDKGTMKIRTTDKNTETMEISGGVVEVLANKVVVLAESVVKQ